MRRLVALGHTLVATPGTFDYLSANGIAAQRVNKIGDPSPNVLDVIGARDVDLVINDFRAGRGPTDNYRIRRAAVEASIASLTSLDTARALVTALGSHAGPPQSLQEYQASRAEPVAHEPVPH
jgi:carbamoyl-phosphate synthase large subunit